MKQQNFIQPKHTDDVWEDLVISILSVNQYTLNNTFSKIETLREVGLFNPENLKKWNAVEFKEWLCKGGCDRGPFMTNLFAERLVALGEIISVQGIEECENILLSENNKAITDFLIPVKGIGPKVLKNFFFLRELSS